MMEFGRVRPAAKSNEDINKIIEKALRLARFDKSFKSFELELDLDRRLPLVFVDPDQIQQVVLNLLLNARDAMPEGGTISISTASNEASVTIVVADTGTGIASEQLKLIFDPFYSTKSSGVGTGLGLAVCYGIITAHGGTIDAESACGEGTRFTVSLSRDNEPADSAF